MTDHTPTPTAVAEVDQLRAEVDRLRRALADIAERAGNAGFVYRTARKALDGEVEP